MKKQYSVFGRNPSGFASIVLGMLGFLTFLLLGTLEAQTGDMITTITTRESANYVSIMDIAVGPEDVLYVARFCWVEAFAPDGRHWIVPPTGEPGHELDWPTGLVVDGEGNIYVSEYATKRGKPVVQEPLGQCIPGERAALRKITPSGEDILLAGSLNTSIQTTSLNPFLIGVDGDKRLYFWTPLPRLWRLNQGGEQVLVVKGGGSVTDPTNPAFREVEGRLGTEVNLWSYLEGSVDEEGNIYLPSGVYVLRIDGQTGVISIVAERAMAGRSIQGMAVWRGRPAWSRQWMW